MHVIKWLSNEKDDQRQEQTVLTYAYVGLKLRDYMSIVRFHITANQITQLTVVAYRENFMANALFLQKQIIVLFGLWGSAYPTIYKLFIRNAGKDWCPCEMNSQLSGNS